MMFNDGHSFPESPVRPRVIPRLSSYIPGSSNRLVEPFRSMEALSESGLSIEPFMTLQSMSDAVEVKLIEEPEPPKVEPPPDGGWMAWTQVLMGHLLVINGFGYISSFGFFQAYYATTLNRPASDISWVGSVQMFLLFLIGTFSGRAMDAGFFRSLIVAGCSLQLIGVFATSFATKYWQLFLAQGITQGLGNGLLFTPTVALVSTYFDKHRTIALGVCACGAPIGGVIFPIIGRQLVPQTTFPWVVRVMGFVILFNTAIVIVFAKQRPVIRKKGPVVEWAAFREPPYSLFSIGIFLALWGAYFAYYYITVFAKTSIHLSPSSAISLLMIMNGIGVAGRLIPAILAARYFGAFNTLIPCVFGGAVLLYSWIAVHSVQGLVVWAMVYGFLINAVQTLFPSTLSFLTTDLSKMGVRVGMVFTIISFACLTGPPIAGALISVQQGGFVYAQVFGGTAMLCGTMMILLARLMQTSFKDTWRSQLGDVLGRSYGGGWKQYA